MSEPQTGAPRRRLRVGLTGGIGSGKSALAAMLGDLGAAVLDADLVAHELTGSAGAAIPAIRAAFGAAMIGPDGALDRARMREAAFADPLVRRRLEAILHPRIAALLRARAAEARGAYVVLVIPLLVENLPAWRDELDRIVVVQCPEPLQIQRVMARSGLTAEQVQAILAVQATAAQRRAVADDCIENGGDLADLREQAYELHMRYLQIASGI